MCSKLTSIRIAASVQTVPVGCFYGCSHLETVDFEIGSLLTEIEENAFADCSSLKKLLLPPGVRYLRKKCFSNCVSLEEVTLESLSRLTAMELARSTAVHR
jgi:hypothetical protein